MHLGCAALSVQRGSFLSHRPDAPGQCALSSLSSFSLFHYRLRLPSRNFDDEFLTARYFYAALQKNDMSLSCLGTRPKKNAIQGSKNRDVVMRLGETCLVHDTRSKLNEHDEHDENTLVVSMIITPNCNFKRRNSVFILLILLLKLLPTTFATLFFFIFLKLKLRCLIQALIKTEIFLFQFRLMLIEIHPDLLIYQHAKYKVSSVIFCYLLFERNHNSGYKSESATLRDAGRSRGGRVRIIVLF